MLIIGAEMMMAMIRDLWLNFLNVLEGDLINTNDFFFFFSG